MKSPITSRITDSESRAGYTLLELMIALGLLGALLSVAWSLLGTYRDAEDRGWKLARRAQILRAARDWLEGDIQHLVDPTHSSPSRSITAAHFIGSSRGFSATIAPSLSPLPFLERLLSEGTVDAGGGLEPSAVLPGSPLGELPVDILADASPWPAERVEIEYDVSPAFNPALPGTETPETVAGASPQELQYVLTRRELLDLSQLASSDSGTPTDDLSSERVLTAQDLYRQDADQPVAVGTMIQESRLEGLCNVQFRYCDGQSWKDEWNSQIAGSLPSAIALSFDFPAVSAMHGPASQAHAANTQSVGYADRTHEFEPSFAESAVNSEALAETPTAGDTSLMQSASHEVQIIVLVESDYARSPPAALDAALGEL